jgi:hypothetical protein
MLHCTNPSLTWSHSGQLAILSAANQIVEASALFATQSVKIDDNDNQDAGDDTLPECVYVQQIGAVVDRRQDEGTEQRPVHRANGTEKTGATDDGGGYRLQFPSFRLGRVADTDARGEQDADEGGAERREGIGDIEHPSGVYA